MRKFELLPNAVIGIHNHAWEHEMFLIEGKMALLDENNNKDLIQSEEFIFMPPDEPHGYTNESQEKAVFICMIPNSNT